MKKETIIWLAGLISTDGTIIDRRKWKHGFRFVIFTVEKDWASRIQDVLKKSGIDTSINWRSRPKLVKICGVQCKVVRAEGRVQLCKTRQIVDQFIKFNCEEYFSPRKWKKVLVAKAFYDDEARVDTRKKGDLYHCGICKQWLPLDKFWKNLRNNYGIESQCIECETIRKKKARMELRERLPMA